MNTNEIFIINNWHCRLQGTPMSLSVNSDTKLLELAEEDLNRNDKKQQWQLIPNLVNGVATGGYTLFNVGLQLPVVQPMAGEQISLSDEKDPYGKEQFCWTVWPTGSGPIPNNPYVELWVIQDAKGGPVIDADGSSCSAGTKVLFWGRNNGDNQRWYILRYA